MTTLLPIPAMPLRPQLCAPEVQPSLPLVDGVVHVRLLVDDGTGERPVDEDDLLAWNTRLEELLPMALERLKRESPQSSWLHVDTVPGMSIYQAFDGRSASRALVLDHLLDDWPLAGVAVATPSADQLLVVPLHSMDDLEALNVMIASARVARDQAETPLTDQALWFDGVAWHQIQVTHDGDHIEVRLPECAQDAIGRLAAMGLVVAAGEA